MDRDLAMRLAALGILFLGLAGCAPEGLDAVSSFDSYQSYSADREAQLTGQVPGAGAPLSALNPQAIAPVQGFDPARVGAAIDAAELGTTAPLMGTTGPVASGNGQGALIGGTGALDANRPRGNAPAGIAETTSEMVGAGSPGISDEQDFNAVSARETIESDKERIARNKAQYQVVQPTALPPRPANTTPVLVEYALSTQNAVGQPIYRRSGLHLTSYEAACNRYRSPDQAQEAFLRSGGPERDPKGIDPDGDGFACTWDPGPFRSALQ